MGSVAQMEILTRETKEAIESDDEYRRLAGQAVIESGIMTTDEQQKDLEAKVKGDPELVLSVYGLVYIQTLASERQRAAQIGAEYVL